MHALCNALCMYYGMHHVKHYVSWRRPPLHTNQFSYTELFRTTHELDKLPAVFFHYDISPIMAKVSVVTVVTAVTVVFQYELSPIMAKVSLVTVVSTHPPRWSTTMVPPAVRRHESSLARGRLFLTCLHPLAHQVTCSPPHPPSGDRGASLPLDLPHRAVRHRGRRLHRRGHARLLPLPPRQAQRQPVSSP